MSDNAKRPLLLGVGAHQRVQRTGGNMENKSCNKHETKSLSNILFIRPKFFTIKMDEGDDMLDHINKVKSLVDQLTC